MNYNIEEIKGFVRSQVDAAVHLNGSCSARSYAIIVNRAIKHFSLPEQTEIEVIGVFGNYDIRVSFNQDAPPEIIVPQKPKSKRLRGDISFPNHPELGQAVTDSESSSSDEGSGGT